MDPRIDILIELLARYRSQLRQALDKVPVERREIRSGAAWSGATVIEHLASTERAVTALLARFLESAAVRPEHEVFDRPRFEQEVDVRQFLDRSVRVNGSQPSGLLTADGAWQNLRRPAASCSAWSSARAACGWKTSIARILPASN